jgi:hypothetical protein
VAGHVERQEWDLALASATAALQGRLGAEDIVSAYQEVGEAAQAAAVHRFDQFRRMLAQEGAAKRPNIQEIAKEDIASFDQYFALCMQAGEQLWQIIPGVGLVADRLAESLIMKHELESLKPQIGLEPLKEPSFLMVARAWRQQEYLRNRLDAQSALNLFPFAAGTPVRERLELLRLPLRLGPSPIGALGGIQGALAQMLEQEAASTKNGLEELGKDAAAALAEPDPDRWPDAYAPETLRLQALAEQIQGNLARAAELAGKSVSLYEIGRIRFFFPDAASHGLQEQARYLFLADPDHPAPAIAACRRAIEAWPDLGQRDEDIKPLRFDLLLYVLAAGDERAAADVLRPESGSVSNELINRSIGYGFAELCSRFVDRPPGARPPRFSQWLARGLQLAPDYPGGRWIAARLELEQGHDAPAVEHLKSVEAKLDARQFDAMLGALQKMFASSPGLKSYVEERAKAQAAPQTRPGPAASPVGSVRENRKAK